MPTYQYACTDCDHAFEQVQSFSDDALTTCPACEGTLRKVFNAVGVVFKGSGFYRTDSRKKAESGSSSASSDSAGSASDSSSGSSTTSDSSASSSSSSTSSDSKATAGSSSSP